MLPEYTPSPFFLASSQCQLTPPDLHQMLSGIVLPREQGLQETGTEFMAGSFFPML